MAQYPMYPYGNPYGYQQPMMNYQPMDRLAQIQQNYNQTIPQFQQTQQPVMGLNGEIVDGIDVVKAKNVDMTGQPTLYPKSDFSEIYVKRLMPDASSRIFTYRPVDDTPKILSNKSSDTDILNEMFVQLRQDLLNEINGVKELVGTLAPVSGPSANKTVRGGSKE